MRIEELRELCLSFPHSVEDVKWGKDLCFTVGGKMFCIAEPENSEGTISFKCTPEKFAELTEREGIEPAPYVARYHWVAVYRNAAIDDDELEDLITRSYMLVFDKLPAAIRSELAKNA